MQIRFTQDAPLRDGTPRREKGWRAFFDEILPDCQRTMRRKTIVHQSPLLKTKRDAEVWAAKKLFATT